MYLYIVSTLYIIGVRSNRLFSRHDDLRLKATIGENHAYSIHHYNVQCRTRRRMRNSKFRGNCLRILCYPKINYTQVGTPMAYSVHSNYCFQTKQSDGNIANFVYIYNTVGPDLERESSAMGPPSPWFSRTITLHVNMHKSNKISQKKTSCKWFCCWTLFIVSLYSTLTDVVLE